ncbi:hypothetical protein [Janthinobacterium lividum]|uniref:hypothetical protein n=1 Tax=Janthinobacterium lividum TaxID=29581 RepID=UPI0015957A43|nr:hypothetical protein [Janthinobacterium lividum]QKY09146.1 hypothetical protein G8765_16235 [Janthinobacterium lividum]
MEDKIMLLRKIQSAIQQIQPLTEKGWPPGQSILRQLGWCEVFVSGYLSDPAPGPLSMGLIATRELDMYGDKPDLALLINDIQDAVNSLH